MSNFGDRTNFRDFCYVTFIVAVKFFLSDLSKRAEDMIFHPNYNSGLIGFDIMIVGSFMYAMYPNVVGYNTSLSACWYLKSHLLMFSIYSAHYETYLLTVGGWIIVMELYPGFSLYRGLYEFSQASLTADTLGTHGMRWGDLSDSMNGMRDVLIIMVVEWLVVLLVAYYIDQIVSSGSGKSPLFFLQKFRKKSPSFRRPSLQRQESKVFVDMEKPDVSQEVDFFFFSNLYALS